MDHILYWIFKIIFSVFLKKHGEKINSTSIRTYINKIENRITLKIKTRYYIEFLTPETVTFLGSIANKITKNKNG